MIPGSWRLGLRLAWRDALAAKARTALVVVLIGLPVLVLTVVDIGYRTYQLSPDERVSRAIGTSDVGVQWSGMTGDVRQGPEGWTGDAGFVVGGSMSSHVPTSASVSALLPQGARVIPWHVADAAITFRTPAGLAQSRLTGLDLADPLTHGMARISTGRAPRTVGEVALTTRLAGTTGLRVGDRLDAVGPARRLRVVGLVTDGSKRDDATVYTMPAAVDVGTQVNNGRDVLGWLGHTARPVTWTDVRRLNRAGFVVLSRAEYLHPSPAAVAAGAAARAGFSSTSLAVPVALVSGMALIEVVLLAGPAFAVGAKRRRRDLALLAATGGTAAQLRRVVLCSGVVLGLLAGVAGVGLGVAVAALGEPLLTPHVNTVPGHVDVRPWELLGLLAVALVTALAASVVPARAAARTPVVAALAGRRGETRVRRRTPAVGLLLVGLGVLLALTASVGSASATIILAGVVLVELGLIACTPALIVVAARAGRHLPLPARLALRDAGRNRSAATPAVAAVMAAVIGATALLLGVAGQDDRARRQYTPTLPTHALSIDVHGVDATTAAGLAVRVRRLLPASEVAVVRGFPYSCPFGVRTCTLRRLIQSDDLPSRVSSPISDPVIVSDGSDLTALLGRPRPEVSAALRAGRVVAADGAAVHHGTVALAEFTVKIVNGADNEASQAARPTLRLPAVAVTTGYLPALLIVPASVTARVHLATAPMTVFVRSGRTPSDARVQAVRAAARRISPATSVYVERGYRSSYAALELAFVSAAVLVAVLGAVVATALANVDGRDDLRILGAVGAAPRVRRTLSGARAAVIAGLGTLVGVPAGALVPLALWQQSRSTDYYDASNRLHFVVPWLPVVALALVVPLVAALIAGALTRSRLPGGAAG